VSLAAVAALALWATADLDAGRLRAMGPGMLPRGVAVLLGAVGLGLVGASLVRRGEPLARWSMRGPLFVCLGVVAFALTIRTLGLVVAGPAVAIVSGAASPETRFRELVVFAILVTAFCVGLFRYALGLPIPVLVVPGVLVL
jgi:putative tricarboxylic transport membrane protein